MFILWHTPLKTPRIRFYHVTPVKKKKKKDTKKKKKTNKKCLRAPHQLGGLKGKKNQSGTFVRSVQKVEPTAPIGRILQTNCVRDVSAVSEQQGTDWSAHVPCKVFLPPTDVTTGHGGQVLKLLSPGAGAAFEDLHGHHHHQCPTPPP